VVHHDVDNQPKLQMHSFFKCLACMMATGDSRDTTNTDHSAPVAAFDDWFNDMLDANQLENCVPGQHFQVNFGFMKGSGYCKKDEEGRTITSIDGFHQGGKLWGSQAFRETVHQAGYIMDPTVPKAAFRNAKAERPNRNFGKTVRCLLYNANLGPEYWSFALLHAVYLKNRLCHCTTNQVPLTAYTGKRPNAKRLRVFGCPIVVRHQTQTAKLDLNTSAGIFLGYTATDKNVL